MVIERKPRFELKLQVVFDDGESFMSGPVADMSESGVFIETVMPLNPGSRVRLTPLMHNDDGATEFDGEVMRKADYDLDNHFDRTPGMGIRFVDVTDEQRTAISALLARARTKKTIS